MRNYFLIFLAMMMFLTACGKKATEQAANSNESTTANSASAPAATPAPSPEPPANAAPVATPATAPAPEPAPKPTVTKAVVIPAGTTLTVRLEQPLGTKNSHAGDAFSATVVKPVSIGGKVVIPASSPVEGAVAAAKAKGKVHGEGEIDLVLKQITIRGNSYPIETNVASNEQKGKGKRTAATTGGGALIGGIAGGGKGAAIGAAAGLAGGALTGNKELEIPAETMLSFQLKKPVTLK